MPQCGWVKGYTNVISVKVPELRIVGTFDTEELAARNQHSTDLAKQTILRIFGRHVVQQGECECGVEMT